MMEKTEGGVGVKTVHLAVVLEAGKPASLIKDTVTGYGEVNANQVDGPGAGVVVGVSDFGDV